jgi:hypothetical protein
VVAKGGHGGGGASALFGRIGDGHMQHV